MEDTRINFQTAELAQEKGFNLPCNVVFDLYNNNIEMDFYKKACLEYSKDCETGHSDKALVYFRRYYNRTNNNMDLGHYITRSTQSLLQKWLREIHNIDVECIKQDGIKYISLVYYGERKLKICVAKEIYEEALEDGLYEALKLIPNGKAPQQKS